MSDSDYQDLREMDIRRQNFVRKYGPHEEFVGDMGSLISEVSSLRYKIDSAGLLDDGAREIIASFRHMVTRSPDHGIKDNGCYLCDRTRELIKAIRGGDI